MWVLGNLSGECASSRDAVLAAGAIRPLGNRNFMFVLYHWHFPVSLKDSELLNESEMTCKLFTL